MLIGVVFLAFIVIVLILIFLLIYMALKDSARLGEVFRGSEIISSYFEIWGGGSIAGRCTVLMIAVGVVMWPRVHIARGHLSPEELANLPMGILIRMRWVAGLTILGCSIVLALLVYGKFFKN